MYVSVDTHSLCGYFVMSPSFMVWVLIQFLIKQSSHHVSERRLLHVLLLIYILVSLSLLLLLSLCLY